MVEFRVLVRKPSFVSLASDILSFDTLRIIRMKLSPKPCLHTLSLLSSLHELKEGICGTMQTIRRTMEQNVGKNFDNALKVCCGTKSSLCGGPSMGGVTGLLREPPTNPVGKNQFL
ncbi:hypothetical protein TNCV_1563341 [Trichonephila clavipes]|nr:hypothetical protein TNCV_1563341 [Trichonephila clavipes]